MLPNQFLNGISDTFAMNTRSNFKTRQCGRCVTPGAAMSIIRRCEGAKLNTEVCRAPVASPGGMPIASDFWSSSTPATRAIDGYLRILATEISIPTLCARIDICIASRESPPRSKKSSSGPTLGTLDTSAHRFAMILKGPANSGLWWLAICPLFLVGSCQFPVEC
jgi:hypothetical protein